MEKITAEGSAEANGVNGGRLCGRVPLCRAGEFRPCPTGCLKFCAPIYFAEAVPTLAKVQFLR